MKKYLSLLALVLVCAMLFAGCKASNTTEAPNAGSAETVLSGAASNTDNAETTSPSEEPTEAVVDAPFFDISWTREADHDTETIRFGADGSFSYSCACGNPVNDSDLCEGYSYDEATKTITLNCEETTDEMVTVIQVVKSDGSSLQLDFNGEIRVFEK